YWRTSNATLLSSRRGDVTTVMRWVAERFHAEVEPLHHGWCWGYAPRNIRGGSSLSNHASGTAIDLNAPAHPLGTQPRANYSRKQIRRIHRIVGLSSRVIRWGGDYSGRKDGMHFEINAGHAAVDKLARKVRSASGLRKENDMLEERVSASISDRVVALNPDTSTVGWFKEYADPENTHGEGDPSLLDGPCFYQIGYIGTIEGLPAGHKVEVAIVEAVKHGSGDGKTWDVGNPVGSARSTAGTDGRVGFDVMSLPGGHIPRNGRVWLRIHCHGAEGARLTRAVGQGWYGR
ncbi:MAG: M15 family metallopeptidase, partial [Streptosporangiales bacterium]